MIRASTSKTRASYNYIEIQGDSIVMQAAWPGSPAAAYRSGGRVCAFGGYDLPLRDDSR